MEAVGAVERRGVDDGNDGVEAGDFELCNEGLRGRCSNIQPEDARWVLGAAGGRVLFSKDAEDLGDAVNVRSNEMCGVGCGLLVTEVVVGVADGGVRL